MEHVHLVPGEAINGAQNVVVVIVAASDVHVEAAMGKYGCVMDPDRRIRRVDHPVS